jgi:large subunit ribosomal protein L24
LKKGDRVKVLRGQFAKKEGKVEKINLKQEKVFVTGIEIIKKDGGKLPFALLPAKLMILELDLGDKLRKEKLESKKIKTSK